MIERNLTFNFFKEHSSSDMAYAQCCIADPGSTEGLLAN